ncbi:DUF3298 and DUF4163 domain-containing protein [bacterium SCSIO 12741]|nr:DUF3298 and DUF4163 domain-containing protein [bacterium SCSIO 12741]
MIKSILLKSLPLVTFVALLGGCDSGSGGKKIPLGEFYKIEASNFEKKVGTGCDSTAGLCLQVDFKGVEIKAPKEDTVAQIIQDSIQSQFLRSPFGGERLASLDVLNQEMEKANLQFEEDFPEIQQEWYVNRDVEVSHENGEYISFRFDESSFLGGAHPNTFRIYTTYSKEDGSRMVLTELLSDEELSKIKVAAEAELRKQTKIAADSSFAEAGFWFPDDQFVLNDNFVLKEDGILFHFNAYEIAPYVYGEFELWIPNEKFRPAA